MRRYLYILLSILCSWHTIAADAFVYSDCVYSWEFGNEDRKLLAVRPVGYVCYQRCKNECDSFIRGFADTTTDQDTFDESHNGVNDELNKDIVDQCMAICQSGEFFTSTYREYNEDTKSIVSKDAITTRVACGKSGVSSASYNYYQSDLVVDPSQNEEIKVSMVDQSGTGDVGNAVYLCGFKSVNLESAQTDTQVWDSMLQSEWPGVADISARSNHNITNWFAKNYSWSDTKIDVKDGDYLEITYGGNKAHAINSGESYDPSNNRNLFVWRGEQVQSTFTEQFAVDELKGSEFILPELQYNSDGNADYGSLEQAINANNAINARPNAAWYGLKGRIWSKSRDLPSSYTYTNFMANYPTIGGILFNSIVDQHNDTKERRVMLTFSGVLNGFSEKYTRLALKHPINDTAHTSIDSSVVQRYMNNVGGFDGSIKWRGCGFRSGERLEYAVVPINEFSEYVPSATDIEWNDANVNNGYFLPHGNTSGNVFFRIKSLSSETNYNDSLSPHCDIGRYPCGDTVRNISADSKYAHYNTTGEYYIFVEKKTTEAPVSKGLSFILNEITDYLFKDDPGNPKNGLVPKIFRNLVTETKFMTIIRILLVLYIAITGLSFITGLAQINQKEAVTRIFKIGFVLTLISQNSWEFFNGYIFQMFRVGSLELIGLIAGSMSDSVQFDNNEFLQDPAVVFSMFDMPFKQLFSSQVWAKILALFFASLLGFVVAIIVMISVIIYALCIARVLMLYLVSIVALGILFVTAPIFICCILFQYTKPFFDAWFKQMLAFALQPIFVVTSVMFLNNLLMTALYLTLSFTACKVCIFGFNLIGFDICFIPGYMSVSGMHHPANGFGLPMTTLASAICFIIIGQAMYAFCGFASSLANMIATSSMFGLDLSRIAASANPVTNVLSSFNNSRGFNQWYRDYQNDKRRNTLKKRSAQQGKDAPRKKRDGINNPSQALRSGAGNRDGSISGMSPNDTQSGNGNRRT